MEDNKNPKQELWSKLHEAGYYTKDFSEFESKYSSPENISMLYGKLNEAGYFTKSEEEFNSKYFSQPKGEQPVGGATSGQGSNAPTQPSSPNQTQTFDVDAELNSAKAKLTQLSAQSQKDGWTKEQFAEYSRPVVEHIKGLENLRGGSPEDIQKQKRAESLKAAGLREIALPEGGGSPTVQSAIDNYDKAQKEFADASKFDLNVVGTHEKYTGKAPSQNIQERKLQDIEAWNKHKEELKPLETKLNEAKKKINTIIDPLVDAEVVGENYSKFTMDVGSGAPVKDMNAINKRADELLQKIAGPSGTASQSSIIRRDIVNKLSGAVDYKILEPDAKIYADAKVKELNKKYGIDEDSPESAFQKEAIEINKIAEGISSKVAAEAKASSDSVNTFYSSSIKELQAAADQYSAQIKAKHDQLIQAAQSGQINQAQYEAGVNALNEEYKAGIENIKSKGPSYDDYVKSINEINTRANRKYQDEIENAKKISMSKLEEKIKSVYGSEEYSKELKAIWGESFNQAQQKRFADMSAKEKSDYAKTVEMAQYGFLYAPVPAFLKQTASAWGNAMKGFGVSLGNQDLEDWGSYLESKYEQAPVSTKAMDLLNPLNFSKLSGQLLGGMAPSLVAGAATAIATEGAGLGTAAQMVATGLAGFTTETAQIAGDAWDRMYEKTGSAADADEAYRKTINSQIDIAWAYAFDGLPFVKGSLANLESKAARIATGGLVEFTTEMIQEYPQNIAEENISNKLDPWAGLSEKLTDVNKIAETAVTLAPVALLGGAGQINSKSRSQSIADSIIARESKASLNGVLEDQMDQYFQSITFAEGDKRARAVASALMTAGHINETELRQINEVIDRSVKYNETAKSAGLDRNQRSVYSFFSSRADQAMANAEAHADDPIVSKMFSDQAKDYTNVASDFLAGKPADFYTVTYKDGTKVMMTSADAVKAFDSPEFLTQLADDKISVASYGKDTKVMDDLAQKVQVQKENSLKEKYNKIRTAWNLLDDISMSENHDKKTRKQAQKQASLLWDQMNKIKKANPKINFNDTQNEPGVRGAEREGQAPIEAQSNQGASAETLSPSGNVQVDEEVTTGSPINQSQEAETTSNVAQAGQKPAVLEEGSTTSLPPQIQGATPRTMVFKDGMWQQQVGGTTTRVSENVQAQAQQAFDQQNEKIAQEEAAQEEMAHATIEEEQAAATERESRIEQVNAAGKNLTPAQAEDAADFMAARGVTASEAVRHILKKMSPEEEASIVAVADKVSDSLKSSGITVEFGSTDEYESGKGKGTKLTEGIFIAEDGKIIIDKTKLSKEWAKTVVFHEGTHPIINIVRNTNPELYNQVVKAKAKLEGMGIAAIASVKNFSESSVDKSASAEAQKFTEEDEFIVELIARVASGKINLNSIPSEGRSIIARIINSIAKMLGKKPVMMDTDIAALKKLASDISRVLSTGADISEIVGKDNVTAFKNEVVKESIAQASVREFGKSGVVKKPILDDDAFIKKLKKGQVSVKTPVESLSDDSFMMTFPDDLFVGEISIGGKSVADFGGGVIYALVEGDKGRMWASVNDKTAKAFADNVNRALSASKDGVAKVVLVKGAHTKHATSMSAKVGFIKTLLNFAKGNKAYEAQLTDAIKDVYSITDTKKIDSVIDQFNAYLSGTREESGQTMKEAANSYATFRSALVKKANPLLVDLAKKMGYGDESFDGTALKKSPPVYKAKNDFVDRLFADLLQEDFLNSLPEGSAYAVLKVTSPVEYVKDDSHPSYPWVIKTKDGSLVTVDIFDYTFMAYGPNEGVTGRSGTPEGEVSKAFGSASYTLPNFKLKPGIGADSPGATSLGGKLSEYKALSQKETKKGQTSENNRESVGEELPTPSKERIIEAGKLLQEKFRADNIPLSVEEAIEIVRDLVSWKDWYDGISSMVQDTFDEYAADYMMFMFGSAVASNSSGTIGTALNNLERLYGQQEIEGLPIMKRNIYEILSGLPITSDKIANFVAAGLGDKNAIPVDMHVWSFINSFPSTKTPSKKHFEKAKEFVRAVADGIGWDPREVQAAMWAANMLRLGQKPDTYEEYIQRKIDKGLKAKIQDWRNKGYKPFFKVRESEGKIETVFIQDENKNKFLPQLEEVNKKISKKGQSSENNRESIEGSYYEPHMTEDGGDYVFFHVSGADKKAINKGIDSTKFNSLRTSREEKGLQYGVASFYTKPEDGERMVGGDKYVVRVAKDKVYPMDLDPNGYRDKAEKKFPADTPFRKANIDKAVAEMAKKDGYEMAVGEWNYSRTGKKTDLPEFRADALVVLKPTGEKATQFESNMDKGMERVAHPEQAALQAKERVKTLADDIADHLSSKGKYNDAYQIANHYRNYGEVVVNRFEDNEFTRDMTKEDFDVMTKKLPKSFDAKIAGIRENLPSAKQGQKPEGARTSSEQQLIEEIDTVLEQKGVDATMSRRQFKEKYGSTAYERAVKITRNFNQIIENLENEGIVKKQCP